ncbi:hypothetical protein GCM10020220_092420 [Nonomuraea rubra]
MVDHRTVQVLLADLQDSVVALSRTSSPETIRRSAGVLGRVARARRTLAMCGVTSEIVVLHTALDALADGYDVIVLADASGGVSERTENAAFRQIEAAGGTVTSVASFVTSMVRDFTSPTGRIAITALHDLMGWRSRPRTFPQLVVQPSRPPKENT